MCEQCRKAAEDLARKIVDVCTCSGLHPELMAQALATASSGLLCVTGKEAGVPQSVVEESVKNFTETMMDHVAISYRVETDRPHVGLRH